MKRVYVPIENAKARSAARGIRGGRLPGFSKSGDAKTYNFGSAAAAFASRPIEAKIPAEIPVHIRRLRMAQVGFNLADRFSVEFVEGNASSGKKSGISLTH
jgi:hypothetical protein